MTEQPIDFQQTPPSSPKKSFRGWITALVAIMAIILSVMSILLSCYLWDFCRKIEMKFTSTQEELAYKLNTSLQSLNTRLNQQQKIIATTAAQAAANDRKNIIFKVQEAEHLLTLSQYNLLFDNNVSLASHLITEADQKLQETNDPSLDSARKELADVIVTLNGLPKVDITAILSQLTAMNRQIDELSPLPTESQSPAIIKSTIQKKMTWKERLLETLDNLKGILSIRRLQEPLQPLPSKERETYLRERIRLSIAEAKWAVLHQDQATYSSSLEIAKKDLACYQATSVGGNLIGMINELQQINLKPNIPDLSKIMMGLRNYISNAERTPPSANSKLFMQQAATNTMPRALPS